MRSRAARLTSSVFAIVATAGAAWFLYTSEQQLSSRRASLRTFDQRARETADALGDIRSGQQAYVAAGQAVSFWMPKVAALLEQAGGSVDSLRATAVSGDARQQLVEVSAAITELNTLDRRARDYIRSSEQLMAGDVVFTGANERANAAARQVEAARLAEYRDFDDTEAAQRRLEALALAGAAGMNVLVLLLLASASGPSSVASAAAVMTSAPPASQTLETEPASTLSTADYEPDPALLGAASICTEFGRVQNLAELSLLLGDAADLMDASGLIVWVGNSSGGDLRPVVAHGYSDETLARIPPVPRSADNAAAAAYRLGEMQVVAAGPNSSPGALVAPMLAADGCIGALTAEIRDQGETLDSVQALATIFAAQLAGVLSGSAAAAGRDEPGETTSRVVSA